jgi:hypothetical protein
LTNSSCLIEKNAHNATFFALGFAAQDCDVTFITHTGFKPFPSAVQDFLPTDILFHYAGIKEMEALRKIQSYDTMKAQYLKLVEMHGFFSVSSTVAHKL